MSPSPRSTRSDCDSIGGPPVSVGSTLASIASKIVGTPAMTCTLPSVKPGAAETGLSIRMAPSGTGHAQAGVVHLHPLPVVMGLQDGAASSRTSDAAPIASATASAVMSSWVGPMPPEVKR
jgi:hypothetical protein